LFGPSELPSATSSSGANPKADQTKKGDYWCYPRLSR
jgi:hypothetical protein